MEKLAKIFYIINSIASLILLLLGLLVLVFNLSGLWVAWNLTGFAFVFYAICIFPVTLLAIIFSFISKVKKFIITNLIFAITSIVFSFFTILYSATWMW